MHIRISLPLTVKVALMAGALGSVALVSQSTGGDRASNASADAAFAKSGLEGAAAISGDYIRKVEQRWEGDPLTLKELADLSTLIVIGTPNRATCHLTDDGRSINTVFELGIDTLIKGEGGVSIIKVVTPGGKTGFANGTTATIRTPGFLRPQIGDRAVWFLKQQSDGSYVLARGRLGVYDLNVEAFGRTFVAPAGGFETPFAQQLIAKKLAPTEFVQAVWAAVVQ